MKRTPDLSSVPAVTVTYCVTLDAATAQTLAAFCEKHGCEPQMIIAMEMSQSMQAIEDEPEYGAALLEWLPDFKEAHPGAAAVPCLTRTQVNCIESAASITLRTPRQMLGVFIREGWLSYSDPASGRAQQAMERWVATGEYSKAERPEVQARIEELNSGHWPQFTERLAKKHAQEKALAAAADPIQPNGHVLNRYQFAIDPRAHEVVCHALEEWPELSPVKLVASLAAYALLSWVEDEQAECKDLDLLRAMAYALSGRAQSHYGRASKEGVAA